MTKILFMCGSIELNRGGISDHIYKLASSLQKLGISCCCLALFDKDLTYSTHTIEVSDAESGIKFYRIRASLPWKEKIQILNSIAEKEQPSLISLQYVPYAFNSRGLPFLLVKCLPNLKYKCHWHFMLHEIWVDPSLKLTNKVISLLQKLLLKILVLRISPILINTTNRYYVEQLRSIGVSSQKLPLFSNIEFVKSSPISHENDMWRFVFFGSIHPEWEHESLLKAIALASLKNNISLCSFILVGLSGDYGEKLWEHLSQNSRSNFAFENLGVLSPAEVSHQLQIADFGVTTTPSHLIEKSSSVAAMLGHGLPVIIPRVSDVLPDYNVWLQSNRSFILFTKDYPMELESSRRQEPADQLQATTQQLIDSISSVI